MEKGFALWWNGYGPLSFKRNKQKIYCILKLRLLMSTFLRKFTVKSLRLPWILWLISGCNYALNRLKQNISSYLVQISSLCQYCWAQSLLYTGDLRSAPTRGQVPSCVLAILASNCSCRDQLWWLQRPTLVSATSPMNSNQSELVWTVFGTSSFDQSLCVNSSGD